MDLKKLFVYVPTAAEDAFIENVINVGAEAAKYSNKIVFLEKSNRIWVKGVFYGTDLETLDNKFASVWATFGLAAKTDGTSALSKTVGGTSYTDVVNWVEAIQAKLEGDDAAIISSYEAADSAIITAYEAADTAQDNALNEYKTNILGVTTYLSYNGASDLSLKEYIDQKDTKEYDRAVAAEAALDAKLPEVKVEGSGLSLDTTTDPETGKKTYTVIADQSIWEFMGTATATSSTVESVLNGNYDGPEGTGAGKVHRYPEAGDVWAVTVTDQGNNTILYACDGVDSSTHVGSFVQIGSAQGVSGVDTTASHGVALTNTASIVGVSVTPGSVAENDSSVITGGAAYTAIKTAYEDAEAFASAEATTAYNDACAYADARATEAQDNAYTYASGLVDDVITAYEAADTAIITAYEAADTAIITAYEAADAAINAAKTKSVAINTADASYMSVNSTNDDLGYAYTINFDEAAMFNYVSDNIWETYSAE